MPRSVRHPAHLACWFVQTPRDSSRSRENIIPLNTEHSAKGEKWVATIDKKRNKQDAPTNTLPGTPARRPSALASPGPPSCPPAWPGASWTRAPNLPPQALQGRNNSWEVLEVGFRPSVGPLSFRWKDFTGSRRGLSWQVCLSGLPSWIQNLNPPPLCGLRAPRSLSLWNHCPVFTRALQTPLSTSFQSVSGS